MSHFNMFSNALCELDSKCIYAGDSQHIEIELLSEDDEEMIISNSSVKLLICDLMDESVVYLEREASAEIESNVYKIFLSSSDTLSIPIGKYKYILQVIYASGNMNIGKGYMTIM